MNDYTPLSRASSSSFFGNPARLLSLLASASMAIALTACGGSGGSSASVDPSAGVVLQGVIEDGKIEGATVFLDLNENKVRDADEPESTMSDENGNFSLTIPPNLRLSEATLARAMLVANVPSTARDKDDLGLTLKDAGKSGFVYLAPAAAVLSADASGAPRPLRSEMPINPITSLIADKVLTGNYADLRAAEEAVTGEHEDLKGKDLFARFTDGKDPAVAAYAKAITIKLGDVREQMITQARKEARDLAAAEGSNQDEAAARAETELRSGQAAREAAVAAIAQVAREREDIQQAVREVLPNRADMASLPPAALVDDLRAKLKDIQLAKQASNAASGIPPPERQTELVARAAAVAATDRVRYIVVFKDTVNQAAGDQARTDIENGPVSASRGRIEFAYRHAVRGFAVSLPIAAVDAFLDAMTNNPNVDRIEVDTVVSRQTTQTSAPWGLDRSDQRALPLSTSFSYLSSGAGVTAFVVDTGILSTHSDFTGRMELGYSAIADGRGTEDCNGHGTHVAGTIGGTSYGIAKSVRLVPVRVLDCTGSGSMSGVIAGIDWVVANARPRSVVNLSLGGAASSTLDQAVASAVGRGITVVAAAGNSAANACNYSPARVAEAITVGATTSSDLRASFSNFGSCLDLFAPGESIKSAWHTGSTATNILSGTSMASPHVAGVVAQLLEVATDTSPAAVTSALLAAATPNIVASAGTGSPNRLVYSDAGSSGTTPPPPSELVKVSISSLSASAAKQRNGWTARVTVRVKRADGTGAPGAMVKGDFTVGGKGVSCTTDTTGTCTLASGTISGKTASVVWTATGISGTGYSYDSSANVQTRVAVNRPL
jgi:subtilisin family serine protease